jgi:hypothetical protein
VGIKLWLFQAYGQDWLSLGSGIFLILLLCLGSLALEPLEVFSRGRLAAFAMGIAFLALGQEALGLRTSDKELFLLPGLGLMLAGSLCLWFLAAGAASSPASKVGAEFSRSQEWILFCTIMALAAALRAWRLGSLPFNWWYDEVNLSAAIQNHVLRGQAPVYVGEAVENPGAYLMVGGFVLDCLGPGPEGSLTALRFLSAFYGFLALIPFYFLARRWLGVRWALLALLIFSCMRWTLIPQRLAFMSAFALFWFLSALYFYWKALSSRRVLDFCLAGLSLGANLHSYTPARAALPMFILFSLWNWRLLRGLNLRQVASFMAAFLLVAAPMLSYVADHMDLYVMRAGQVSIMNDVRSKGWTELWVGLSRHLLMFNFRGDHQARHNLSFWPQLDFLTALAFFPALGYALLRSRRDARASMLLIWFWVMLSQGFLTMTVEAPQGHRSILVAPCVALAVAWFSSQLFPGLGRLFSGAAWPRALKAAGLVLVLAIPAFNATELFGAWAEDPATWRSFSPEASMAARRAMQVPQGAVIFVSPLKQEYQFHGFERDFFIHYFLKSREKDIRQLQPNANAVPPCTQVLALWGASDEDISAAFKAQYPDIAVETGNDPYDNSVLYLAAEIPFERLPRSPKGLFFRP